MLHPGVGAATHVVGYQAPAAAIGIQQAPAAAAASAVSSVLSAAAPQRKVPSNAYNVDYFDQNKQVSNHFYFFCFVCESARKYLTGKIKHSAQ